VSAVVFYFDAWAQQQANSAMFHSSAVQQSRYRVGSSDVTEPARRFNLQDNIARVDIVEHQVFGPVVACFWRLDFQARGPPHAHVLIMRIAHGMFLHGKGRCLRTACFSDVQGAGP
jgi:hypothetical protein